MPLLSPPRFGDQGTIAGTLYASNTPVLSRLEPSQPTLHTLSDQ